MSQVKSLDQHVSCQIEQVSSQNRQVPRLKRGASSWTKLSPMSGWKSRTTSPKSNPKPKSKQVPTQEARVANQAQSQDRFNIKLKDHYIQNISCFKSKTNVLQTFSKVFMHKHEYYRFWVFAEFFRFLSESSSKHSIGMDAMWCYFCVINLIKILLYVT